MTAQECFKLYIDVLRAYDALGITEGKKAFEGYTSYPKDEAVRILGEDVVDSCIKVGMLEEGLYDTVIPHWDKVEDFENFTKTILTVEKLLASQMPEEDEDIEEKENE